MHDYQWSQYTACTIQSVLQRHWWQDANCIMMLNAQFCGKSLKIQMLLENIDGVLKIKKTQLVKYSKRLLKNLVCLFKDKSKCFFRSTTKILTSSTREMKY